jgi:beta-glucosidase
VVPGGAPTTEETDFLWAGGIEDTFIPQVARSTGRVLDEYDLTGHYDAWREDLDRAAELGIRYLRYGIPWYRVNPAPGRFDWSWTDEVFAHMTGRLGITPIVDLVHYGCPLWLTREFVHPDYPSRIAEYAAAAAARYGHLTDLWTPLNEPLVNAAFSGLTGRWPPHLRGRLGWMRVLLPIVDGMQRTVQAIRAIQPQARIVHVEATSWIEAAEPSLADELASTRLRQFLPTDLFLGAVDETHPLRGWLVAQGASDEMLDRLVRAGQRFDIFGVNFYPGLSCHRLVLRDGRCVRRRFHGGAAELVATVRAFQARYAMPVMITETSTHGSVGRRARWMHESLEAVSRLRADGVPVVGYTWWPLFSLVAWSYRRGGKELVEYLVHMGLWDLDVDGTGRLARRRTPLVDRYRRYRADTLRSVGPLHAGDGA